MKRWMLFLTPFLMCADGPDRATKLVETMRQLTFAGDQPAVGCLVPTLIHELVTPHPNGALGWNQIGVCHAVQGRKRDHPRKTGPSTGKRDHPRGATGWYSFPAIH